MKDEAFNLIRRLPIIETRSDEFLTVLAKGTVSTNVYLRRLQNLAIELGWLAEPVLRCKLFPKPGYKKERVILQDEHVRIIERERNVERQNYYEVIWRAGRTGKEIYGDVQDKAIASAKASDKFVCNNPYAAVGMAADVGALIGYFVQPPKRGLTVLKTRPP